MSIEVKAKETGFYKGSRIREGATFSVPDGTNLGKWMEPVLKAPAPTPAKAAPAKAEPAKKEPTKVTPKDSDLA